MAFNKVTLEQDGDVAILTLDDPDTLNAVSMDMIDGLNEAFDSLEGSGKPRCLLMTGAGRGFSSGANLMDSSFTPDSEDNIDVGPVLENRYHPLLRRLRALEFPFITAVNGAAAGIGMSIALMGDLILAARSAYFLQAFKRIGLVPDGGSTWLLPRLIGLQRAKELSILAEKLPAEKAFDCGLINRVIDDEDLMPEALKLAKELADGPTASYRLIRKLYAASPENSYEAQLALERDSQQIACRSHDFKEGVAAFAEKRATKFTGE